MSHPTGRLPGMHRRASGRTLAVVLTGLAVVATVAGCGGEARDETSSTGKAFGAVGRISEGDVEQFEALQRLTSTWNTVAGRFVSAYLDPEVSAAAFVAVADREIVSLQDVFADMVRVQSAISDSGVRLRLTPLVDNYHEKLAAIGALRDAVARGDVAAEREAQAEIDAAASDGRRLACELFGDLADLVPTDDAGQFELLCEELDG